MEKKKWGDRKDGVWLKDIPSMNRLMPGLMPHRTDNEAHISVDIDLAPINAYLAKLNEGRTEDKYTFFLLVKMYAPFLYALLFLVRSANSICVVAI